MIALLAPMRAVTKISAVALVAAAALAAYALWGRSAAPPRPTGRVARAVAAPEAERPPPVPCAARPAPVARPASAPTVAADELADEDVLMARLRQLWPTEPEAALALARAGEERHPDSPAAPERAWVGIRSLEALGRFHEARDEARRMVAAYPASSWSADVERHVLVYPLDQPSREETQERLRAEAEAGRR
ncbi:MAG TPA: hypothetical protein PLU22_18930 [Polyangiaceae bacterium]|nr:hypothetical protein [Polyangiaceae bacterium]